MADTLIADGDLARPPGAESRATTLVAVGVLFRPDGSFLMTTRPEGKAYAGYWEFPGGKVEAGESVADALRRELREELAIEATAITPWRCQKVDYPHALVQLEFCKVTVWTGEPQGQEGQVCSWQRLPVHVQPVLPGALPVLDWMVSELTP